MLLYTYLLIFISLFIIYIFNKNIEIYNFGNRNKKSKNILIIGGTHGDEPSSTLSLYKLITYLKNKKIYNGFITIIPKLNKFGYYVNDRYAYHFFKKYDINRCYPNKFFINKIVTKLIPKYDFIIDHHEGYHYHKTVKESIGSSLSLENYEKLTNKKIKKILNKLNKTIPEKKEFVFNKKKYIPDHSLRDFIDKKYPKKKYILLETTGKFNKEPIRKRTFKSLYIILSLLRNKNVIKI